MIFDKFRVRESNSKIDPKRIPQNFVDAAADFERSKTEEAYKSRNLAWKVAGVFGVAFLLSAASNRNTGMFSRIGYLREHLLQRRALPASADSSSPLH